jgi:murein DD-endopeptidase MepM/ murein hydrolase activator NlpD
MASGFGYRTDPFTKRKMHEGMDFTAKRYSIYATGDGVVAKADTASGYGNHIVIRHGFDTKHYTHI